MKRHLLGPHAVHEALEASPQKLAVIWVVDDGPRSIHADVLERARARGVRVECLDAARLDAVAKGVRHQGILGIGGEDYAYANLEAIVAESGERLMLVVLDEITDVHNFGAILRSAVAMGAHGVVTLRDRAAPVNAAVVRTSAGATEHAKVARVTNLAETLAKLDAHGVRTVGLDADAPAAIADLDLRGPCAIVVGSEGKGLRRLVRERCSTLARIPMSGPIASLNASVAVGIALYEVVCQRSIVEPET